MKYIDAEKLKEEIDNLESFSCISEEQDGFYSAISRINGIIDSLQQEQPETFDTAAFQKGVQEGKRLMMEGAVKGTVIELGETYKDLSLSVNAKELNQVLQPLGVGDGNKVKIIIVKEEEK